MTELAFLGIAEASRLIAARKLSPVELTEACLGRIAAFDSQLDSFVTLTADRARAEAKAAEAAIMAAGPVSRLHGIPYCLKDIFDTAGIRTTAMSKLLADNVPVRDAHSQQKLAAAGGVLVDDRRPVRRGVPVAPGTKGDDDGCKVAAFAGEQVLVVLWMF